MKDRMYRHFLSVILGLCWAQVIWGVPQDISPDREFKDPQGRYMLTLKEGWEDVIHKDGAGNPVVYIMFEGDRERGLLRIRERRYDQDVTADQFAQRERDMSLRFLPGYTQGSMEPFTHKDYKDSVVLSFDFTYGGRPKTARYYYLKIDPNTYYTLLFEGNPQVLRTMRNRLDFIARSFRVLR